MEEIARERGGRCLSAAYLGNKVKLTWECNRGHVWDATPVNITSKGRWCPTCAILRRTRKRQKRLKWDYEGRE
ncbi:zinc-ribbon domain-containing protein [Paraburkholderia sp. J10-1]|uniref:zinc-ribbon domain-containing protein n=1 Tax=Paraburkholderia sp. J10-1 TaxID=2805430 RepID=UPI002AB7A069|nr:zinc-ribbon domain-containing protein [Paraburkholderia sp. J10-1]